MRVVNGYAVCAGDCPMFRRAGPGRGLCSLVERPCLVGQLCFVPVQSGGTRYPFGRFGAGRKYRVGPTSRATPKLKVASSPACRVVY